MNNLEWVMVGVVIIVGGWSLVRYLEKLNKEVENDNR
jgi:hypothetical protein